MPASRSLLPYLGLLAGILSLSMSAIFVRWANAPGIVMALARMGIATLALAPVFAWKLRKMPSKPGKADLGLAALGGLMIALDHSTWNTSIQFTSVANATLFNNLSPLWVALIAWLFWHERLRFRFWLGLAVTMVGAVTIMGDSLWHNASLNGGDAIAVLSSLFYALYFMITQRARARMQTLVYIWLAVAVAVLILLAACLVLGLPLTGYPTSTYLAFLGAGLFSQIVGYFGVGYALGHLPASIVAPTMIAQPLVTMLLAIPLTGEGLSLLQVVGGLAILSGIYLVNRRE
jgi:drug/metabolite transporter (DMT)-like permease